MLEKCQGHSGHLDFPMKMPFYHPVYIDDILRICKCTCAYCNRLLLPLESMRCKYIMRTYRGKQRLQEMVKACAEIKRCGACPKEEKWVSSFDDDGKTTTTTTKTKKKKKQKNDLLQQPIWQNTCQENGGCGSLQVCAAGRELIIYM